MIIDILTLFPEMFHGPFDESIIKRAKQKGLVTINLHNIRDHATDKHKTVDDTPFGGGAGMLMKVDVLVSALESVTKSTLPSKQPGSKIVLLSAKGQTFNQAKAREFASLDHLVLVAGHYEGVDERLVAFIDEEISIGDYILTGGELGAMVITDAITRLIPGAISEASITEESFATPGILEYPQYTKPAEFRGQRVPDVLLSGNHQAIQKWRKDMSKKKG